MIRKKYLLTALVLTLGAYHPVAATASGVCNVIELEKRVAQYRKISKDAEELIKKETAALGCTGSKKDRCDHKKLKNWSIAVQKDFEITMGGIYGIEESQYNCSRELVDELLNRK